MSTITANLVAARDGLHPPKMLVGDFIKMFATTNNMPATAVLEIGFNVSSLWDAEVGVCGIYFITPMTSANYNIIGSFVKRANFEGGIQHYAHAPHYIANWTHETVMIDTYADQFLCGEVA